MTAQETSQVSPGSLCSTPSNALNGSRATAATGIESTLSLPILQDGVVVAGINLYASTPDAFEGHHDELAEATGGWAEGAVRNADMGFTTRFQAAETPGRLREENLVDQATGALMSQWGIPVDVAEERLRDAAQRAGISDAQMARAILSLFTEPQGGLAGPSSD